MNMNMKKIVSLAIMASGFTLLAPVTTYAAPPVLPKKIMFENQTKETKDNKTMVRFEIQATKADGTGGERVSSGDLSTGHPGSFPQKEAPYGKFFGHEGSVYKVFVKTKTYTAFKDSGEKQIQWRGSSYRSEERLTIGSKTYKLDFNIGQGVLHMALFDAY